MSKIGNFVLACSMVGSALSIPTAASAKEGWMSCLIVDDANKNAFYSESPIAADDSAIDKAYAQYIVFLRLRVTLY